MSDCRVLVAAPASNGVKMVSEWCPNSARTVSEYLDVLSRSQSVSTPVGSVRSSLGVVHAFDHEMESIL
jgi:hypothetical protein